jgi:DNA-binding response OmpR family regulator
MPKILIADDSRVYVHLITGWLHDRGFEVLVASDAMQASMTANRSQPDAIILDINMPGGSGIDVLKRLKISTKTKHIPILVVSGNGGSNMRELVKNLGAADLLEKPLDCNQFCELLSGLLLPASPPSIPDKQPVR